jgi:hypothetical protein
MLTRFIYMLDHQCSTNVDHRAVAVPRQIWLPPMRRNLHMPLVMRRHFGLGVGSINDVGVWRHSGL